MSKTAIRVFILSGMILGAPLVYPIVVGTIVMLLLDRVYPETYEKLGWITAFLCNPIAGIAMIFKARKIIDLETLDKPVEEISQNEYTSIGFNKWVIVGLVFSAVVFIAFYIAIIESGIGFRFVLKMSESFGII